MKIALTIIAFTSMAVGAAVAQTEMEVGPREEPPKIEPGEEPRPVTAPQDGRRVAVLNIRFEFDNGRIAGAELQEARRIAGIAPKAFQRQGGDWQVRINGSEQDAFYVFSPAYLEAETAEGAANPYTWVAQDGPYDWTLVVPLYRGPRTIEARSVTIVDRASGETILEAAF